MDLTWFQFLLFVHIAGATVWLGGAAMIQFFALRALRAGDAARTAAFARDVEWIGFRVFTPASALVLLAGILMVLDSDFYGFGDDWVLIALVLFVVTFATGFFFFGPESGRIGKLIEAEGPESAQVQSRIRRILALSRADLVLLYLIAYDMVVKPSATAICGSASSSRSCWRGYSCGAGFVRLLRAVTPPVRPAADHR